jgi:hypothetical protein
MVMAELSYGEEVKATEEKVGECFRYGMCLGPVLSWGIRPAPSFLGEIEKRAGCKVTNAQMEGYVTFSKPVSAEDFQYAFDRHLAVVEK